MSAIDQVLDTAELLELILLQDLSTIDVAKCQRICRFFKAVIDNSKPIRRILFLEPDTVPKTVDPYMEPHTVTRLHPALRPARVDGTRRFSIRLLESQAELDALGSSLICQPPSQEVFIYYKPRGPRSTIKVLNLVKHTIGALMEAINHKTSDGGTLYCIQLIGPVDQRSHLLLESRTAKTNAAEAKPAAKVCDDGGKADTDKDIKEDGTASRDVATDKGLDEEHLDA